MAEKSVPKLRLIHGKKQRKDIEPASFQSPDPGPQTSLFPKPKPGVVLFVLFPEIAEREFIEVIESSKPSYVFDLRLAPRFDIGRLNRQLAFDLFESAQARYVDLTIQMMAGSTKEVVQAKIRELLGSTSFNLSRPVVFLLGHSASSVATDSEILAALSDAGKEASEVVQIPCFA